MQWVPSSRLKLESRTSLTDRASSDHQRVLGGVLYTLGLNQRAQKALVNKKDCVSCSVVHVNRSITMKPIEQKAVSLQDAEGTTVHTYRDS